MAMNKKESRRPLVSVIIRTRDRPELLRQAIESVMAQVYSNIEIIIVNDGGHDVTAEIEGSQRPEQIRYIVHQVSLGRAAAANVGLRAAVGKYVNFLDDDDLLYPNHVHKLVNYLESNDCEFVYSDCEIVHYTGTADTISANTEKVLFKGANFDRDRLYFDNYIPMMTAMFARRLLAKSGLMDESFEYLEDWDLWLRMAEYTDFHRVPGSTAEYRMIGERTTPYNSWKRKIYHKHNEYWTIDNMMQTTWPKLYQLADENISLGNQLLKIRRDIETLSGEKEALNKALDESQKKTRRLEQALAKQ